MVICWDQTRMSLNPTQTNKHAEVRSEHVGPKRKKAQRPKAQRQAQKEIFYDEDLILDPEDDQDAALPEAFTNSRGRVSLSATKEALVT